MRVLMEQAYNLVRERHGGYFTQELALECMAEIVAKQCAEVCRENGRTYEFSFTPAKARVARGASDWCAELIEKKFVK